MEAVKKYHEEAVEAINALYNTDGGSTGGYGHIVFDDQNTEDEWIESCINDCIIESYKDTHSEAVRTASLKALRLILKVDEEVRFDIIREALLRRTPF